MNNSVNKETMGGYCTNQRHAKMPLGMVCLEKQCQLNSLICNQCIYQNHRRHEVMDIETFKARFISKLSGNADKKSPKFTERLSDVNKFLEEEIQIVENKCKEFIKHLRRAVYYEFTPLIQSYDRETASKVAQQLQQNKSQSKLLKILRSLNILERSQYVNNQILIDDTRNLYLQFFKKIKINIADMRRQLSNLPAHGELLKSQTNYNANKRQSESKFVEQSSNKSSYFAQNNAKNNQSIKEAKKRINRQKRQASSSSSSSSSGSSQSSSESIFLITDRQFTEDQKRKQVNKILQKKPNRERSRQKNKVTRKNLAIRSKKPERKAQKIKVQEILNQQGPQKQKPRGTNMSAEPFKIQKIPKKASSKMQQQEIPVQKTQKPSQKQSQKKTTTLQDNKTNKGTFKQLDSNEIIEKTINNEKKFIVKRPNFTMQYTIHNPARGQQKKIQSKYERQMKYNPSNYPLQQLQQEFLKSINNSTAVARVISHRSQIVDGSSCYFLLIYYDGQFVWKQQKNLEANFKPQISEYWKTINLRRNY